MKSFCRTSFTIPITSRHGVFEVLEPGFRRFPIGSWPGQKCCWSGGGSGNSSTLMFIESPLYVRGRLPATAADPTQAERGLAGSLHQTTLHAGRDRDTSPPTNLLSSLAGDRHGTPARNCGDEKNC